MLANDSRGSKPPHRVDGPRLARPNATQHATQVLRRRLSEGSWSAGDKLPSEPALAGEVGVSRVSIRAALAQLESEGLVNRRHGSGTYVNSVRPLVSSLHMNVGSDTLIKSAGQVPGVSEMSWKQIPATEDVARSLAIEVGTPVIDLYRVRTADGSPVTIEHDYFAVSLLPNQPASLVPSLYSFLSTECGVDIVFGVAILEPSVAGELHGPIFGVPDDELCLTVKQKDYDASERCVVYIVEQHLANAFDFQLVRQGPYSKSKSTMPR